MPNNPFDAPAQQQPQAPIQPQPAEPAGASGMFAAPGVPGPTALVDPPSSQQAAMIDLEDSELFARERLSGIQKGLIVGVVVILLLALLGGGYWIYTAFYDSGITIGTSADPVEVSPDIDTDQDGLTDARESTIGTDPANPDSDGDGYADGEEVKNGFSPLKK